MKKVFLGKITVDSGMIVVIDPCYLNEWVDGEADVEGNHYYDACQTVESGGGEIVVAAPKGTGVVFQSGLGDGIYSVYAYKDNTGTIRKIEIEL